MKSRFRRAVRSPFLILPVLAVLGLAGWALFRPDDKAPAAESAAPLERIVTATKDTMDESVTAEGTVEAAETDDLSFTSAGTVTAVNVKAGDEVHAGDVLATIDSAGLESAVADAEASVADAEAALEDLEDSDDASDQQVEAKQSSLEVAQDQLDSAKDALSGAKLVATIDGTVSSVGITKGEELSSGGTGGTSTTGSGSGSGQSSGNLGSGGATLPGAIDSSSDDTSSDAQIQVVSTGRYSVELDVDKADVANLAVGQKARVSLSTGGSSGFPGGGAFPGGGVFPGGGGFPGGGVLPGGDNTTTTDGGSGDEENASTPDITATQEETPVNGFVTEVGTVADASSGVASYPVTVVFSDDSGELIPGATASVEITYSETEPVVQVSSAAVTTTDGASTVTVDLDGKAGGESEKRTVKTGRTSGGMTEITDGLKAGDHVVITFGGRGGAGGQGTPPAGFTPPQGGSLPSGGAGDDGP